MLTHRGKDETVATIGGGAGDRLRERRSRFRYEILEVSGFGSAEGVRYLKDCYCELATIIIDERGVSARCVWPAA